MLAYTPNIFHFKVVIYFTMCCGIWPLIATKNKFNETCYLAYSWLTYSISALCSLLYLVGVYNSIVNDFNVELAGSTATFSMVYVMGLIRVHYMWKAYTINLLEEVIEREQQIYNSEDESVKKIYDNNVRVGHKINYYFWISHMTDSILYLVVVYPFYNTNPTRFDPVSNETIVEQKTPYHFLSIFNPYKHFMEARAVEGFCCLVGALINYGSDTFFHSLMAYILGQFKIIHHILKNFSHYQKKVKGQINCDDHEGDIITFKLCINEHQRILRLLNQFNEITKYMMLIDFLQSSVQVGVLIIYVMKETNIVALSVACGYSVFMICRLGIYYWYASEITTEILKGAYSFVTFVLRVQH